jgi:hypothetical protein
VRTQCIIDRSRKTLDYALEIETNMDRWQSQDDVEVMTILQGVDEEEQQWHVGEYLRLQVEIASLDIYNEKLGSLVAKNNRTIRSVELTIMNKNAEQQKELFEQQLKNTYALSSQVLQKIDKIKTVINFRRQESLMSGQAMRASPQSRESYSVIDWGYEEKSEQINKIVEQLDSLSAMLKVSREQVVTLN